MLHVDCWESDILLLRPGSNEEHAEPESTAVSKLTDTTVIVPKEGRGKKDIGHGTAKPTPLRIDTWACDAPRSGPNIRQTSRPMNYHPRSLAEGAAAVVLRSSQRFEALTQNEEWTDDVELLRSILRANRNISLRRTIGNQLKATNPARFSNQRVIGNFLTKAIEAGVVVDIGHGDYRELVLPSAASKQPLPVLKVLLRHPKDIIPDRVFRYVDRMPSVLFCPVRSIRSGTIISKRAFVHRTPDRSWLVLMFCSLTDAYHVFTEELPTIHVGATLVDWNTLNLDEYALVGRCCGCGEDLLESEVIYPYTKEEDAYCSKCYRFDSVSQRRLAASRVVSMLTMMAENDDGYLSRKVLKKLIYQRFFGICTTHRHAEFGIDEAVRQDKVVPFKMKGQKKIYLCLGTNLELVNGIHPPEDYDTTKEEKHVEGYLAKNSTAWVSRRDVIESLKKTFPKMGLALPEWTCQSELFHRQRSIWTDSRSNRARSTGFLRRHDQSCASGSHLEPWWRCFRAYKFVARRTLE